MDSQRGRRGPQVENCLLANMILERLDIVLSCMLSDTHVVIL